MEQYIPKSALVAEIEKRISEYENCGIDNTSINAKIIALQSLLIYINTLEVKEIDEKPNPRFPHYEDIVDKVFGAGNLESWEYSEAEMLVSLAKEELLKDIDVKEVDLQKEIDRVWDNTSDKFSEDGWKEFEDIANHFFELGVAASNKTQKGEEV